MYRRPRRATRCLPLLLEREVPRLALRRDPAELGELVHRERSSETPPSAVLDTTERHLRLIVNRLVVDVHDAGLESIGHRHGAVRISREDARSKPIPVSYT